MLMVNLYVNAAFIKYNKELHQFQVLLKQPFQYVMKKLPSSDLKPQWFQQEFPVCSV